MFYSCLAMLGSWNQPRVGGPRERLSESMRGWVARFGSVVNLLIFVNVVVFFVQLLCSSFHITVVTDLFALSGSQLLRGFVWQPVTYMFLHDTRNLYHILFNLLALWFFGREVEYFIGPKYFTRLYFCGGLAGAALWLAFNLYSSAYVLGASAAVLACVIAFATLFPDREVTLLLFFVLPVSLRAKYLAIGAVLITVALLFNGGGHVAHLAHLGGAALGYIYIKQLGYGATPRWLWWFQSVGEKLRPRRRPQPRVVSDEEYMEEEVDPILDKIAREGMQSLTRHERKILEAAKDHLPKRHR
jgi:membrane associated rhomboid family serine protease